MYVSSAFSPSSGSAQPEYHDSGMAIMSSFTRSWAIAAVCGEPVAWLMIATWSLRIWYFSTFWAPRRSALSSMTSSTWRPAMPPLAFTSSQYTRWASTISCTSGANAPDRSASMPTRIVVSSTPTSNSMLAGST